MYKVTVDGAFAGYSDTAVFVRLHENGCYIPCERSEAEGVCVKLPCEITMEDGETITALKDIVFNLPDKTISNIEQTAELEQTNGALLVAQAEEVVEILLGGGGA